MEKSKKLHAESLDKKYKDSKFMNNWHDLDVIDTRRHYKILDNIIPVIQAFGTDCKWLTIGDQIGREAIYLKRKNIKYVICSSLKHQFKNELLNYTGMKSEDKFNNIDEVEDIDVENISKVIPNNSVDFIMCKESFHHFPRPFLGLYKMLETCKKGVILLEPQEKMNFVESYGKMENEDKVTNPYESIGNFKYELNLREICKSAWALYFPHVIVKGFNDPIKTLRTKDERSKKDKWDKYLHDLNRLNLMGLKNERNFNLISCIILKNKLHENERKILINGNYKIYDRPMNRHIQDEL